MDAATGVITTVPGLGATGFGGEGGPATAAHSTLAGSARWRLTQRAICSSPIASKPHSPLVIDTGIITTRSARPAGFGAMTGPSGRCAGYQPASLYFDKDGNLFLPTKATFRIRRWPPLRYDHDCSRHGHERHDG